MAATTTPDPEVVTALRRRDERIVAVSAELRAKCHDAAVGLVNDAETWYTPDGVALTVGNHGLNDTTLIVDGAVVDLDEDGVIALCHRLLSERVLRGNTSYRVTAAWELLRNAREAGF